MSCAVAVPLHSLSVPTKHCMYQTMTLYALQHSEMPSCVLPSHTLWIDLHFNRFCHMQPKVPQLPGPCPAPSHCSTMALQDLFPRPAAPCETLNSCSWAWEKCCWWKTCPASPSSSPEVLQSHHGPGNKPLAQPSGKQSEQEESTGDDLAK